MVECDNATTEAWYRCFIQSATCCHLQKRILQFCYLRCGMRMSGGLLMWTNSIHPSADQIISDLPRNISSLLHLPDSELIWCWMQYSSQSSVTFWSWQESQEDIKMHLLWTGYASEYIYLAQSNVAHLEDWEWSGEERRGQMRKQRKVKWSEVNVAEKGQANTLIGILYARTCPSQPLVILVLHLIYWHHCIRSEPQVWLILFLVLLATSASTCLQHSRNLGRALKSSPVASLLFVHGTVTPNVGYLFTKVRRGTLTCTIKW